MTTRRVYKKELQKAAGEVIEALEKVLGSEVSNKESVIKAVDAFIRGETAVGDRGLVIFPLLNAAVPNGTFHIVFECWPLKVTLRTDPGAMDTAAVKREYEALRSTHPHIEVRFREIAHEEMKSAMRKDIPVVPPKPSHEPPPA